MPKVDGIDASTFYMSFAKSNNYGTTFFIDQKDRLKTPLFDLTTQRAIEPEDLTSSNTYLYYPRLYVASDVAAASIDRNNRDLDKIFTLAELQNFFTRQRIVDIDLKELQFSLLLTNPAIPRILTVTFDMKFPESRAYSPGLVVEVVSVLI